MDVVKKNKVSDDPRVGDKVLTPKLAMLIEQTLQSFGITTRVVEINFRPNDTEYCLEVALGTTLESITKLHKDLAMAIASPSGDVEIEAPIPGRAVIAVRVPYEKAVWERAIAGIEQSKKLPVPDIKEEPKKIEWLGARSLLAWPLYHIGKVLIIIGNICCELGKIVNQR